jgi:hypothetical protein
MVAIGVELVIKIDFLSAKGEENKWNCQELPLTNGRIDVCLVTLI